MINFANKTDLILALNMAADMGTVSASVETPSNIQREIGDLARLAILKGKVLISAVGGTGSAVIRVLASGLELGNVTYSGASSTELAEVFIVDLTGVAGHSKISLEVECATTGDPLIVNGWLEIEHPIIIGA